MPEIEIKIWTMKEGKVEEIMIPEFDNQIFVVKEKAKVTYKVPTTSVRRIADTTNTERGKTIKLKGIRTGHQNVLDECKQLAETGNYNFTDIIEKYYPKAKRNTIIRYTFDYRDFLGIKVGRGNALKRNPKTTRRPIAIKETIVKKKRKRRRKPTPDCAGFNKKYEVWIRKDEMHKVKLAINTVSFGYRPNTNTIAKQTGLTKCRTNAVLDYMITKKLIKRFYKDSTYQYNMI